MWEWEINRLDRLLLSRYPELCPWQASKLVGRVRLAGVKVMMERQRTGIRGEERARRSVVNIRHGSVTSRAAVVRGGEDDDDDTRGVKSAGGHGRRRFE